MRRAPTLELGKGVFESCAASCTGLCCSRLPFFESKIVVSHGRIGKRFTFIGPEPKVDGLVDCT